MENFGLREREGGGGEEVGGREQREGGTSHRTVMYNCFSCTKYFIT